MAKADSSKKIIDKPEAQSKQGVGANTAPKKTLNDSSFWIETATDDVLKINQRRSLFQLSDV